MPAKLTIKDMQDLAASRGGKCLSQTYINSDTRLDWECEKGHRWSATPGGVKQGKWCIKCYNLIRSKDQRLSIEEMQKIAVSRGGKCLSNKYFNTQTKLEWQCRKGHTWKATPGSVKSGKWCAKCGHELTAAKERLTIEEMRELAKSRGGTCLSKEYINNRTKLKWQCEHRHVWQTRPEVVIQGNWCPYCAGLVKGTIEQMREIAASKGGKCLSQIYINSGTKLKWCCKEGHTWEAVPDSIKRGSWCEVCSQHVSQRICKAIFEKIFNKKFKPNSKPDWLVFSGNKLQLDGFCEELQIAFEYQGRQHYRLDKSFFHRTNDAFIEQKRRDGFKKRLCKSKGIILIIIPYTIRYQNLVRYIVQKCKQQGLRIPKNSENINYLDLDFQYPKHLEECQELANAQGGKCLSKKYVNSMMKLEWVCKEGHTWKARPNSIQQGQWCPKCRLRQRAEKRKLTIKQMQEFAKSHNGICISKNYVDAHSKLNWQCEKGHQWQATPNNIQQGQGCPKCGHERTAAKERSTIKDMQRRAASRGGKCLSKIYVNARTEMKWRCKEGHIWQAVPYSIKQGSWCPKCAKKNTS